ncbi:MAG: GNAT family N-acetyltransferase [Bacteroidia bacterium]
MQIELRDLAQNDIEPIANYWLQSDQDFLIAMGVDLNKIPTRNELTKMLEGQLNLPDKNKASLALIIEVNGKAIGHCNVNEISFGKSAKMHLHLWSSQNRKLGLGTEMVKRSVPQFFRRLQLKTLWCEPAANNPAPNKTLKKLGFNFVKKHKCIPGYLCFEQEANLYKLSKDDYTNNW